MKKFTTFFLSQLLLLYSCHLLAQHEPIMSLVTTIKLDGATELIFEPSGTVLISFWNEKYLQLNIQIDSSNLRREQLKTMVPMGIFKPATRLEGKCLVLNIPGLEGGTLFNGREIKWNIRYNLKLPKSIEVVRKDMNFN